MQTKPTRFWRALLAGLLLAAIALCVAAMLFQWNAWPQGTLSGRWQREHPDVAQIQPLPAPVTILGSFFTMFTSGLILLFLFPQRLSVTARAFHRPPLTLLRLGLLGLLAGLLVSVAALSASLTMLTFALTVFLSMVLLLGILYGAVALAYRLGQFLLSRAGLGASPISMLLVGQTLLFALINLPGAGILALIIVSALGLGAAIYTHFGSGRPWSLISLREEGKE